MDMYVPKAEPVSSKMMKKGGERAGAAQVIGVDHNGYNGAAVKAGVSMIKGAPMVSYYDGGKK